MEKSPKMKLVAFNSGRRYGKSLATAAIIAADLSDAKPQRLTSDLTARADVVVTMGCGDACPYIPGKRYIDWDLPDPKGRPLDEVRALRDEIERRVRALADELD